MLVSIARSAGLLMKRIKVLLSGQENSFDCCSVTRLLIGRAPAMVRHPAV